MPRLRVGDGVELHYEEQGFGPLVVLGAYWSLHPSAFGPIIAELSRDHRVVHYHDRGTGESTRVGPYDLDTAAADLAKLIEALGAPAVIAGPADAPVRGVRVAAARPELVTAVVSVGGAPIGRSGFEQSETLVASDSVVGALLAQVETDYRGALRGILTATNPQMSEDELRDRVAAQVLHCPQEAAAPQLRAWAEDEPQDYAKATGERLWVIVSGSMTGGWFPHGKEMTRVVKELLPRAHLVEVEDGWVSRPDQNAAVIREITAGAGAEAGESRISA